MEEPTEAKMIENETEEKAVEVETNGEIGAENSDVIMKDNETAEVEEAVSNNNENAEDKTEDAVSDKVGGRKRKASEMKDGEEVEEGSKEKKKAEVVENVEDKNEKDSEKETTDAAATVAENEVAKKAEKDKEVVNDVELNLPQKEFFGKGKRARIPNKRYSDILLSPPSTKSSSSKAEKVERVERVENGSGDSENEERFGRSGSPSLRKKTDMTNPSLKKPFKYGWKRELVWRATSEKGAGKMGDIYYYTPSGKKIRSMREMSDVLKGNKMLTLENFTYTKEPIGLNDPEKEIIRDAKLKVGATSLVKTVLTPKATKSKAAPAAVATKAKITSPKPSTSKAVSPKANRMNETADSKPESPKTVKGAGKKGNFKIKFPGMKSGKGKAEKMDVSDEEMEAEPTPPPVHAKNTRRSAKWSNEKRCLPCSIRCPGVLGTIPTLQCCLCLCLYHHECVGAAAHVGTSYICKKCHLEQADAPPQLQPISALQSVSPPTTLPKLQRMPNSVDRTDQIPTIIPEEMPRLTPRPQLSPEHFPLSTNARSNDSTNKSLVGSVTTWLPHNSKIVGYNEPSESIRPQYLEILNGRKFLVIPKHNFMSVSPPTVAATPLSRRVSSEQPPLIPSTPEIPSDQASLGPYVNWEVPSSDKEAIEVVEGHREDGEETPKQDGVKDDDVGVVQTSDKEAPTVVETPPVKAKKRAAKAPVVEKQQTENAFMEHYLQNVSYGYSTLLYIFQYLKVQDLLRAGCVCTLWRDIAGHPLLWHTVRMKNSQVHSFEGLANTLKRHGTVHLDLRKMLLPNGEEIWPEFTQAIEKVDTLRKIELCRCPSTVVEQLANSNPQLEVINAVTIKDESMSLEPFSAFKNIKELRLKSTGGMALTSNIDSLKQLTSLKHLSLTSVRQLHKMNLDVIAELVNLESLDLGECSDFPKNFGEDILSKLTKLEKLRLEKGQGTCHTCEILDAVKDMPHLEQLELVNFDIKAGFDKSLGACLNVKKLLIIPTYISQSATTNHLVLGGVLRLHKTLSHFVWGVTLELLRVTELFVDQCDEPSKEKKEKKHSGNGDSIPVLKPVPTISEDGDEIEPAHDPPQVEILPLPNLQKLLLQSLPTTRVKILKIPFHATWRQSITDSVN